MSGAVKAARKTAVSVVYNGDTKVVEYQPHEAMQALLEQAKKVFGVVSNHLLSLFMSSGTELGDAGSVEDAGIEPGDKLVLGQSVIRGGR
jgi:hypothetical protein